MGQTLWRMYAKNAQTKEYRGDTVWKFSRYWAIFSRSIFLSHFLLYDRYSTNEHSFLYKQT